MSGEDLWVVPLGLLLGYWVVSAVLLRFRESPVLGADSPGEAGGEPQRRNKEIEWSAVLGVSTDADVDTIREAYRRVIVQYHPDKVAALGPELQRLAAEKTREINVAYQEAMRSRRVT